jgi:hypothetical protein
LFQVQSHNGFVLDNQHFAFHGVFSFGISSCRGFQSPSKDAAITLSCIGYRLDKAGALAEKTTWQKPHVIKVFQQCIPGGKEDSVPNAHPLCDSR